MEEREENKKEEEDKEELFIQSEFPVEEPQYKEEKIQEEISIESKLKEPKIAISPLGLILFVLLILAGYFGYRGYRNLHKIWTFNRMLKDISYANKVITKTRDVELITRAISTKKLRNIVADRIKKNKEKKFLTLLYQAVDNELLDKEKDGVDTKFIELAITIIGEVGEEKEIHKLKKYLDNPYSDIYSAYVLSTFDNPAGIEKLFELLNSGDKNKQISVCKMLQVLRPVNAGKEVAKLLEKPVEKEVHLSAIDTLIEIGTAEEVKSVIKFYLKSDDELKNILIPKILQVYDIAELHLGKELLHSKDKQVINSIISLFHKIGRNSAIDFLLEKFPSLDEKTKLYILEILPELSFKKDIPKIKKLLGKEKTVKIRTRINQILQDLAQL